MKRVVFLAVTALAIFVACPAMMRNKNMTDNEKHLKQAEERIKAFEVEKEPERLNEASMELENVILAKETDPQIRAGRRKNCLFLWLTILQTIDQNIDPKFNPEDVPAKNVQPPPLGNGVVLRPGADPAKIPDPQARADYEKAIAENRAKAINYRLQIQLGRLNEQLTPSAETFIRSAYTSSPDDQKELKSAIDGIIQNPERRTNLNKLLKSPE
jgi:hypothetical protein